MGASSFIGKNLIENLKNIMTGKNRTRPNLSISAIFENDYENADVVIILPETIPDLFIEKLNNKRIIFITSFDNNKEEKKYLNREETFIYRSPEIIGKWQEPTHGIAYYCHAVANDETLQTDHSDQIFNILFIDDFLEELLDALEGHPHRCDFPAAGTASPDHTAAYDGKTAVAKEEGDYCYFPRTYSVSKKKVLDCLETFNQMSQTFVIPEIPSDSFVHKLYSMYLSYLPERKMSYPLRMQVDNRGVFSELIKTTNNGQIAINIARPENVRGQHWHNTKWEIFIVVSGHGLIQERKIGSDKIHSFEVRGEEMRAVIMLAC